MAGRKNKGFRDLLVWQKGMEALELVHAVSSEFPKHELFGLTSQIRRAAYSVVLNISEGYKRRRYPRDFLRQLITAHGSEGEVETAIEIAVRLKYVNAASGRKVWKAYDEVGRMLEGLIKSVERDIAAADQMAKKRARGGNRE